MLTTKHKETLSQLLLLIGQTEQTLENLRSTLCELPTFEPITAFRQLDTEFTGIIDEMNIQRFIKSFGYEFNLAQVKLYMKAHSQYDRMVLQYHEFVKTLIPYDNKALREQALSRPSNIQDQQLSHQTGLSLARLIVREIESYTELEQKKHEFQQQLINTNTRLFDAFNEIDQLQTGSFDYQNLNRFFMRLGYKLSDSQLICILRALDKSEQGKIILQDFVEQMSPVFNYISKHSPSHLPTPSQKLLSDLYQNNQDYYLIESQNEFKSRRVHQFKKIMERNLHAVKLPFKEINIIYQRQQGDMKEFKQGIKQFTESLVNPLHIPPRDYAEFLEINYFELKTLLSTLYQFIKLDKETHEAQLSLTISQDFNALDVFRGMDTKDRGYLTAGEMCKQLKSQWKINIIPRDMFIVIRRFQDSQNNGKLRFKEFVDMVVPKSKSEAKFFNCRLPYCQNQSSVPIESLYSKETIQKFQKFIKTLIMNECVIEGLKQRLQQRDNFQLYSMFQLIDRNSDELVTQPDLLTMFENFAVEVNSQDLQYLLWRFKSEEYGIISFSEFLKEMTPTSPKLYSSTKK